MVVKAELRSGKKNASPTPQMLEVVEQSQSILTHLLDLNSQIKQAHWNVEGRGFLSFHRLMDEVYHALDEQIDELAERIRALGAPVDGTPRSIVANSDLDEFPDGIQNIAKGIKIVSERLETVSGMVKSAMSTIEMMDPLTHDLLLRIAQRIDQFAWLVRSHSE